MNENDRPRFAWGFLVRRGLAVLAGAVFLYAGSAKVTDPLHFASDISNYQIVSWSIGVRLAFYLPWLEILCGLSLIFHRLFTGAVVITSALMLVFIGVTVAAKARGIDVACGCFGSVSSSLTLTWHLVLNGCILAALVILWLTRDRVPAVSRLQAVR
jgi:putative oxidoreductase